MRKRFFEIVCDFCGCGINHYPQDRPTDNQLREDGIIISKGKHFCNKNCKKEFIFEGKGKS